MGRLALYGRRLARKLPRVAWIGIPKTWLAPLVEVAGIACIARGAFLAGPIWGYVVSGVLLVLYASLGDIGGRK